MRKLLIAGTLFVALTLSPFGAAWSAILFAGGEDLDFTLNGNTSIQTSSSYGVTSGYSRETIGGYAGNGGYLYTQPFTASTVIWVHARNYSPFADGTNLYVMGALSPDGYLRIVVRTTGTQGIWKISTVSQSGTVTDLVTMGSACVTATSTSYNLDLYINYSTSGEVTFYCNGAQYADYVGNVTTNSATQLNKVGLWGQNYLGNNGAASYTYWTEVIVATTSTLNMRLVTLSPVANGNTHNWDSAAVSNVNPTTINSYNFDYSGTSGEIDEYTVGTLPAGLWNVVDVRTAAQAQVGTSGPQHLQAMVRTGGTNFNMGFESQN